MQKIENHYGEYLEFSKSNSDQLRYKKSEVNWFDSNIEKSWTFNEYQNNWQAKWENIILQNENNAFPSNKERHIVDALMPEKLDEISVFNSSSDMMRKIFFTYKDVPEERLKLEEVTITNGSGTSNATNSYAYKFEYHNHDKVGDYLTAHMDHWGFFNGDNKIGNAFSFPGDFMNLRSPSTTYSKNGTLNSITFPTGGTARFTYGQNRYSHYMSEDKQEVLVIDTMSIPTAPPMDSLPFFTSGSNCEIAGGLRVEKIQSLMDPMELPYPPRFMNMKMRMAYVLASLISNLDMNGLIRFPSWIMTAL